MPAGHHSNSDSTLFPLPKSSITCWTNVCPYVMILACACSRPTVFFYSFVILNSNVNGHLLLPHPVPLVGLCLVDVSYETPPFDLGLALPPLTILPPTSRSWCYQVDGHIIDIMQIDMNSVLEVETSSLVLFDILST